MICINKLTCKIDEQTIISDVSLTINQGDHVVLSGSSGAGKSSLMKALIGACPIVAGSVSINDQLLSEESIIKLRSSIAFIPQEPALGTTTVEEALLLPFTFKRNENNAPSRDTIEKALTDLGLTVDLLEKQCSTISGGEKQRVAIARALLLNKKIIFADEVTSALDPYSKECVMNLLFKKEYTVVSVSHDVDWIQRCSRNIVMEQGLIKEEILNELHN